MRTRGAPLVFTKCSLDLIQSGLPIIETIQPNHRHQFRNALASYLDDTHMDDEVTRAGLASSITIAVVTLLLFFPLIQDSVVKPRLYDGSVNELGRYAFTFDAYEYIEDNSENPVIAIGSSKMREIFNGITIGENTTFDGDFYNLAYAGDKPYIRMIEIDAIIELNPKLIIIEIGANTFSSIPQTLDEGSIQRMSQLMALNTEWGKQSWKNTLLQEDVKFLPMERSEQILYTASLTPESLEKTFLYEFEIEEKPYSCDPIAGRVHCVPLQNDAKYNYDEYLQYPTQFENWLKGIKEGKYQTTIEEFYGERLDNYLDGSYHNSEGIENRNQIAFEFMLESLTNADIPVLLVGLPYNPVLIDRLDVGQWDYYNLTTSTYAEINGITVHDLIWNDNWVEEDFNDFTHASREGEVKFTSFISPLIDSILVGD